MSSCDRRPALVAVSWPVARSRKAPASASATVYELTGPLYPSFDEGSSLPKNFVGSNSDGGGKVEAAVSGKHGKRGQLSRSSLKDFRRKAARLGSKYQMRSLLQS